MTRISAVAGPKRATNLTLSERLIEEARALDVNLSRAAEYGIAAGGEGGPRRKVG